MYKQNNRLTLKIIVFAGKLFLLFKKYSIIVLKEVILVNFKEVLNEYLPLKELLYNYKEKYLFENKLTQVNNRDIFGYGSGYGILPYFEGGVGVSSYYKIFNTIGLEFKQVNDTLYIITKK